MKMMGTKTFRLLVLIIVLLFIVGCSPFRQLGEDLGKLIQALTPEPTPTYGAILITKEKEHEKFCKVPEHRDYKICQ